ncbi:MAG TPA: NnrS family protein [Burkholderiales bacterium]
MRSLWNLGFRPFYLLASLFSVLWIVVWVLQYVGRFPSGAYLQGPLWHGHEMVFGYTLAVIAGFLLTAVRNWTGRPTPSGSLLAALAALWVAARIAVLTPFATAAMWLNASFPVAVAVAIGVPLVQARNRRNYLFVALLLGVAAAILVLHLAMQGDSTFPARSGLVIGLDIVLFVISVIAGRVVPMFTNNGVPGARARRNLWVERAALGGVLLLLALDVLRAPTAAIAAAAAAAALVHAVRLALWDTRCTLGTPLVWVLHAGYAWVVVHLALRAGAAAGLVSESLALHALSVGAIGGLTIGMMTRTARGHTARPLVADRWETTAYVLVLLAAVVRVFGGWAFPSNYVATVIGAAALWSAGFGIYFVRYWPILTRPRLDGRPG